MRETRVLRVSRVHLVNLPGPQGLNFLFFLAVRDNSTREEGKQQNAENENMRPNMLSLQGPKLRRNKTERKGIQRGGPRGACNGSQCIPDERTRAQSLERTSRITTTSE